MRRLRQGQVPLRWLFLRIMPPSWHPVPACTPRLRCRRAILYRHDDCAASIPKSRPEIKNHCTLEGINRQNHASIRKSGLEIKNRCTQEGVNRHILAVIPKFTPSNQESLQPRGRFWAKPCSDSQVYPMKSGITAGSSPSSARALSTPPATKPPRTPNILKILGKIRIFAGIV